MGDSGWIEYVWSLRGIMPRAPRIIGRATDGYRPPLDPVGRRARVAPA